MKTFFLFKGNTHELSNPSEIEGIKTADKEALSNLLTKSVPAITLSKASGKLKDIGDTVFVDITSEHDNVTLDYDRDFLRVFNIGKKIIITALKHSESPLKVTVSCGEKKKAYTVTAIDDPMVKVNIDVEVATEIDEGNEIEALITSGHDGAYVTVKSEDESKIAIRREGPRIFIRGLDKGSSNITFGYKINKKEKTVQVTVK